MSTHRISGVHNIQCDAPSCHEFVEGESGEGLRSLWERARGDGWVGRADGFGDFDHFCPDCARETRSLRRVNGH